MARYPKCIFCKKTDSPPSEEDIFARWIAREWPKGRFKIAGGFIDSEPDARWGARSGPGKHSGLGFTTTRPCERCNCGWMSRLESAAKPILQPLLWGKALTIASDQQLIIARWLMKTAMTWEFFNRRAYPRFFTPAERFEFHLRPHLIPPRVAMVIGHYIGGHDFRILEGGPVALELSISTSPTPGHGYVVTFSVGQLAFQVFAHRWSKDVPVRRVNFAVPGDWRTSTYNIWPQHLTSLSWPPRYGLDDKAMADLAERFYKLRR